MQISFIGEYQLANLIANQVPFLYLFLSESSAFDMDITHPLLKGVVLQKPVGVIEYVIEMAPDQQYPIVLICQDGQLSQSAGENLAIAGYLNIFVIRGGLSEIQ